MTAQSDWLPMMMAIGFAAPLTGARRGPSRRESWHLRLKEGREGRKRGGKSGLCAARLGAVGLSLEGAGGSKP
jgi:hypothetical protein